MSDWQENTALGALIVAFLYMLQTVLKVFVRLINKKTNNDDATEEE